MWCLFSETLPQTDKTYSSKSLSGSDPDPDPDSVLVLHRSCAPNTRLDAHFW